MKKQSKKMNVKKLRKKLIFNWLMIIVLLVLMVLATDIEGDSITYGFVFFGILMLAQTLRFALMLKPVDLDILLADDVEK